MPCHTDPAETAYYENMEARKILEKMGIEVEGKRFVAEENINLPNHTLCELCSNMTLEELKEKGLEKWYISHLRKDREIDTQRVIDEMVRLYK